MIIGVCCPVTEAAEYARLGFDYFEPALAQVGALSAADWADWLAAARQAGLPALVMNIMLPGSFRLTGPAADHPAALDWLDAAFARAVQAGTRKIVFGSGGARNRPEGTELATGLAQLTVFARDLAALASRHGLCIGLEALRAAESNILTTQAEAAAFVKTIDSPAFGLTVDAFHMGQMSEPYGVLSGLEAPIIHAHIASAGRHFPKAEDPDDYATFIAALREAGYDDSISIEASDERPLAERGAAALSLLRGLTAV